MKKTKKFQFLAWFNLQYPVKPRRDVLSIKRELTDAQYRVDRLKHELEYAVLYHERFTAAMYTRNATEDFYTKKGKK